MSLTPEQRREIVVCVYGGSLEAAFDAFAKERDEYRTRAHNAEGALHELRQAVTKIYHRWEQQ